MSIGVSIPLPAYLVDPALIAKKAEDLGFESIWYAEHPAVPVHSNSPFPSTGGEIPENYSHFTDPYIALARASGVTSTIKLGTGITLVPERNPLLLAKEIAALDLYSGGRFLFGVGTGWLREETELMGGNFDHRWSQTREAIEVMKALWTNEVAEFHGEYFDFPPVKSYPKPVQKPHPPVILGGMAPPGPTPRGQPCRRLDAQPGHSGGGGGQPGPPGRDGRRGRPRPCLDYHLGLRPGTQAGGGPTLPRCGRQSRCGAARFLRHRGLHDPRVGTHGQRRFTLMPPHSGKRPAGSLRHPIERWIAWTAQPNF